MEPKKIITRLMMGVVLLTACTKDKVQPENIYAKTGIAAVVNSNFSLSLCRYALVTTHYDDTLSKPGPYTLLGPSNDAFTAAGWSSGAALIRATDSIRAMMPYHFIRGAIKLDSLPMAFNQPLTAGNGQPLYVTHWVNSRDTAIVVNGVRVSTFDKPATNGLVNITDGVLYPIVYNDVQQAVSGDPALSMFNAAIIQSGLAADYNTGGPYTVFAPVNAAFNAIGVMTVDSVYKMDVSKLQKIVKAHIATGRNFIYDYILKADVTANTYQEHMLSGAISTFTLVPDPLRQGRFAGITLQTASGASVSISRKNILAGNGVVHSISGLLNN
ncbi:fasciclin domain-containing protein [Chitinophaga sp. Cy-1792]|uniref:fasciclin domain-containing protein n=1 Tax=Chitinophaga sp. Cy-1792 TaxID=2608339 RepID=UPI0014225FB4|nr:fasciclin domain-containing protein [Chitinophaga sp. Cy-1792]NIG55416.1 fasciclin domain-containing protein [Chitinophaga sp. Cy-1792]